MEQREYIVEAEGAGQRIDRFLSGEDTGLSRSALQGLVAEGHVLCNGKAPAKSLKLKAGDIILLEIPDAKPIETSSMRMRTFWWSTSPKGWSSTRLPATRTAPWSTLCSGTARAAFPALAARSGPASSTASIRTPAVCWWWQRMIQPTSAFPSRWQCTAWSGPTIPSSMRLCPG